MIEHLVLDEQIPARILLLVQDMTAYRFRSKSPVRADDLKCDNSDRSYMNVLFHKKGMDMINLPKILNCKKVTETVP